MPNQTHGFLLFCKCSYSWADGLGLGSPSAVRPSIRRADEHPSLGSFLLLQYCRDRVSRSRFDFAVICLNNYMMIGPHMFARVVEVCRGVVAKLTVLLVLVLI